MANTCGDPAEVTTSSQLPLRKRGGPALLFEVATGRLGPVGRTESRPLSRGQRANLIGNFRTTSIDEVTDTRPGKVAMSRTYSRYSAPSGRPPAATGTPRATRATTAATATAPARGTAAPTTPVAAHTRTTHTVRTARTARPPAWPTGPPASTRAPTATPTGSPQLTRTTPAGLMPTRRTTTTTTTTTTTRSTSTTTPSIGGGCGWRVSPAPSCWSR